MHHSFDCTFLCFCQKEYPEKLTKPSPANIKTEAMIGVLYEATFTSFSGSGVGGFSVGDIVA